MGRAGVRELAGWSGALAVSLITAAQIASSARSELLFRDGDSLIVGMFARSLLAGGPADWALSSVLFVPETAVFAGLDALLPLEVDGVLAVNAVLNLLALFGALRLVAGRRRAGSAPVAWSLLGLTVFCLIAMTEMSTSRDALELASLSLTTTYYSGTVIAAVLSVGFVRRFLDRPVGGGLMLVLLVLTAAVSTLSNPLYAVWSTVPLALLLTVLLLRSRERLRPALLLAALLCGTAVGFLGRIPLQAWITKSGAGYAQPERWAESLDYYSGLFADRLATPAGVVGSVIVLALLALAVHRTVRVADTGARVVAAAAWITPLLVAVGAVALGTHAARYLQPLAFAPVLALVAWPRVVRVPRRARLLLIGATGVLLMFGGALSIPRLATAAGATDPDRTCVTDWVDASDRVGGGQFWTVRLPKLHLEDPARLVQVDHELNGYAWLVDRRDFEVGEVSFLVEDAQTVPWQLPVPAVPDEVVDCGRYRILDFGAATLPLGPQRS